MYIFFISYSLHFIKSKKTKTRTTLTRPHIHYTQTQDGKNYTRLLSVQACVVGLSVALCPLPDAFLSRYIITFIIRKCNITKHSG